MSISLNPSLLLADWIAPKFAATIQAHGLYNTQQFVLRLSPENHRILSALTPGISTNNALGFEGAQAMSTYLHETIHWWQHIGSTYGFIFSLNYPIQCHVTHFDLLNLIKGDGFKKSVFNQAIELSQKGPGGWGTLAGTANTVVNNHFDLLAFRSFTLGPAAAKEVIQDQLFEAVGHAFRMTYSNTVNIIGSTVDPEFKVVPHPKEWEEAFIDLRNRKVEGFYYGSPIDLWPIGSCEIFEGQARFSQIQFLSHACGHRLTWESYKAIGMLSGVYVRAFDEFIRLSESKWPDQVDDPLVGLFLLVCDLSLNPGSGFPFHIFPHYQSFIHDTNPGARFCMFSRLLAGQFSFLKERIKGHTKSEYEEVSSILCGAMYDRPPMEIASAFSDWFSQTGALSALREEYESYSFRPENYVIRHQFSHFLAFQDDKSRRPEFFCWPGAWLAGEKLSEREQILFEKHGALFVDKENDDGIYPRMQHGRTEQAVDKAFQEFYQNAVVYDLVNQWIGQSGPFKYDLSWLKQNATEADARRFQNGNFLKLYGISPDEVQLI